jgi:ribosomal protein L32E
MDPKQFLLEQGYSEADAATLAADEKMSRAITGAISRWTEAETFRAEADRLKKEAEEATRRQNEFWTGEAVPALTKAEGRVATAEAERARLQSYLQSLKNQGYDVPAEYITAAGGGGGGNSPVKPPDSTPPYVTRDELSGQFVSAADSLTLIQDLNNEYHSLFGAFPTSLNADFKEAQSARRPLRDYVRDKYKFADKKAEIEAKKLQESIDSKVREQVAVKEKELAAKYGSNPDLRVQIPSKFDSVKTGDNKDSWKTAQGRDKAKRDRLERFSNIQ